MYEYIKGIIEDIGTDYIVLEAGRHRLFYNRHRRDHKYVPAGGTR